MTRARTNYTRQPSRGAAFSFFRNRGEMAIDGISRNNYKHDGSYEHFFPQPRPPIALLCNHFSKKNILFNFNWNFAARLKSSFLLHYQSRQSSRKLVLASCCYKKALLSPSKGQNTLLSPSKGQNWTSGLCCYKLPLLLQRVRPIAFTTSPFSFKGSELVWDDSALWISIASAWKGTPALFRARELSNWFLLYWWH